MLVKCQYAVKILVVSADSDSRVGDQRLQQLMRMRRRKDEDGRSRR